MADIHVGDVGTMFKLVVKDENDEIVPLDDATSLTVVFALPDKTVMEKTGELFSDGLDGIVKYVTKVGDISKSGTWKIQAIIGKLSGLWHSEIVKFKVDANLG